MNTWANTLSEHTTNMFECIDGPYKGMSMPCPNKPVEGYRKSIYIFKHGNMEEAYYELRSHPKIVLITGQKVWQWFFIPPNKPQEDK